MITCKSKEGVFDILSCSIVCAIGRSSGRPVGNPIKTNLQQQRWSWWDSVSSWTWRGAFLRQPNNLEIISCLWKNVGQAITFPFMLLFDTKILAKDCHTNHQPECRPLGKDILRHFSCSFRTSSDKCFGTGSRGVPKPIQPMSLLNPGLWRLLAGFFPKAGIRLPLLRNFRNRRKRL